MRFHQWVTTGSYAPPRLGRWGRHNEICRRCHLYRHDTGTRRLCRRPPPKPARCHQCNRILDLEPATATVAADLAGLLAAGARLKCRQCARAANKDPQEHNDR